jgi:hypothetical protein
VLLLERRRCFWNRCLSALLWSFSIIPFALSLSISRYCIHGTNKHSSRARIECLDTLKGPTSHCESMERQKDTHIHHVGWQQPRDTNSRTPPPLPIQPDACQIGKSMSLTSKFIPAGLSRQICRALGSRIMREMLRFGKCLQSFDHTF